MPFSCAIRVIEEAIVVEIEEVGNPDVIEAKTSQKNHPALSLVPGTYEMNNQAKKRALSI